MTLTRLFPSRAQCGNRRHRRRCHRAGKVAALLEPLAPEAASSDSLAIYTDALYSPPKGLHPPVQAVRPYAVQVSEPLPTLSLTLALRREGLRQPA